MAGHLPSWNETPTLESIVSFVEQAVETLPVEERVAVFDNDGTLWCEKPLMIELAFILQRLAAMAEHDASLRGREPWRAAHERDYDWLADVVTRHYAGDDGGVRVLLAGILQAFAGWSVEEYAEEALRFVRDERHPTLARPFRECTFLPMVELLRYLEAHGFTCYIASGGNRDFMRPVTEELYGIPPERVIGTSSALRYEGGAIVYLAEPDVFDDGPAKPVRIWSRVGRRPVLAAGNSNGDLHMLEYSTGDSVPGLRLLVLHDDPEREFGYTAGAETSLERARADGWTVVSVKDDWAQVFAS